MSVFDLPTIVESLRLRRVKLRNDALTLLRTFSVAKLKLTPRHFVVLLDGLLKLIEIELEAYSNNSSAATQQRLLTASSLVKDITEEMLKSGHVRYKHFTSLVSNMMALFYNSKSQLLLAPCVNNFGQILNHLLYQQFYIIHLSLESWIKHYNFLVKLLKLILKLPNNSYLDFSHESLLTDLLSSLHYLIGGGSSDVYEPLKKDKRYLTLQGILKDIFDLYNGRESAVLVEAFKLIIKLLVSLSTDDVIFCHKLIHVALSPLLAFVHTSVDTLLTQFVIFLNIDSIYRYLDIDGLPQLITLDVFPACPSEEDETNLDIGDPRESLLSMYKVSVLAQALLSRLVNLPLRLTIEDVGSVVRASALNWFELPTMELRTNKELLWLLYLGTCKLLCKYYELSKLKNFVDVTQSFRTNSYKRLKIQSTKLDISSFDDMQLLLKYMIEFTDDSKIQTVGLQLLAFTCDSVQSRQPNTTQESFTPLDAEVNFNETTVIDIRLDEESSGHDYGHGVICCVIKCFNNATLTYWCLLSTLSVLRKCDLHQSHCDANFIRRLHQLTKLLVPLIKNKEFSELACKLFNHIVFSIDPERLSSIINSTILTQLESVVDLAEINGPSHIHNEAICFWWALHWAMSKLTLNRSENVSKGAGRWLLSKWSEGSVEQADGIVVSQDCDQQMLADFIVWLHGHIVDSRKAISCRHPNSRLHRITQPLSANSQFEQFVSLENDSIDAHVHFVSVLPCAGNDFVVNSIIDRILRASTNLTTANEILSAQLYLAKFVTILKPLIMKHLEKGIEVEQLPEKLWRAIFMGLSTQEEFVQVLEELNSEPLKGIASSEINIIRRQLEEFYHGFVTPSQDFSTHDSSDVQFDQEFSSSSVKLRSTIVNKPFISSMARVAYFRFLSDYDKSNPLLLEILSNCEPVAAIECIEYMLNSASVETLDDNFIMGLIRHLGEGPLSSHWIDRSSQTIVLTSKLLTKLMPLVLQPREFDWKKDFLDLLNFLTQCERKSLFLTENAKYSVSYIFLEALSHSLFEKLSDDDILRRILSTDSNSLKSRLLKPVEKHISQSNSIKQIEIYRKIFESFPHPQETVEKAATYCYFLGKISNGTSQVMIPAIFNLLECSRFDFFVPYLEKSFQIMSNTVHLETRKQLFLTFRLEILKSWWHNGIAFEDFPYGLFNYVNYKEFIVDNYRQLVAVCIAVRSERLSPLAVSVLRQIGNFKGYDTQSLVYDSLSILIPLAYTSGGVRNEVFKTVLPHLNDSYKGYLKEKVLLMILETLKLTNVSSEASLAEVCSQSRARKIFNSEVILDSSMRATITPVSSVDLMKALISKFWAPERGKFWTTDVCFFLIRQIGLGIQHENVEEIHLCLRRIKFVICQSDVEFRSRHMIELLVDICVPLLHVELYQDVSTLLSLIDFDALSEIGSREAFVIVGKITNVIFNKLTVSGEVLNFFLKVKESLTQRPQIFGSFTSVVEKSVDKLSGICIEAFVEDFEDVLHDVACPATPSSVTNITLDLLKSIYCDVSIPAPVKTDEEVVKLFLRYDFSDTSDNEFGAWVARYLSSYYLTSSNEGDISNLITREEMPNINRTRFSSLCSSLDFIADLILELLQDGDYEAKAFTESIIGAIIWKYELRKDDSTKFLTVDKFYEKKREYIVPMDFHSCLLVISGSDSLAIENEDLNSIINSLETRVNGCKFFEWSCQLSLAFFQEVAKFSSMASLFASCIIRYPSLAARCIPDLVCFYATLLGTRGAQIVCDLVSKLCDCVHIMGKEGVYLLADIVLRLRIGSKIEGSPFIKAYNKLNLIEVFTALNSSARSKSALMILEDATKGLLENIDWNLHRGSLIRIYESIDDYDMLFGIPENANLSSAMQMEGRLGSTSDVLKNSMAHLDAAYLSSANINCKSTMNALLKSGLIGVAKLVSQNLSDGRECHEWSWKLNLWDIPLKDLPLSDHEVIYNYLKRLHGHVPDAFSKTLQETFVQKSHLFESDLSTKTFHENLLRWFVALASITEVDTILSSKLDNEVLDIIDSFSSKSSWFSKADLKCSESILLCRREAFRLQIMLSQNGSLATTSPFINRNWEGLIQDLLVYGAVARLNNHLQKMMNAAVLLDDFVNSPEVVKLDDWPRIQRFATFSIAQTLWAQGNINTPIAMLKNSSDELNPDNNIHPLSVHSAMITSQLVQWLAESKEELGSKILNKYVEPIEDLIAEVENLDQRSKSYQLLASFCEQQFKMSSLNSQISEIKKRIESKKGEIEVIKLHYGKTAVTPSERKSVQKYYNRLKGQVAADSLELESLIESKMTFASKSTRFYLKALLTDNGGSESVDRFISLFLELSSFQSLQSSLKEELCLLPSHKALSWCTQLMARLSDDESDFQTSVQLLISRICYDHPYHSLYMLLSLLYHKQLAQDTNNNAMLLRVEAAMKIREQLTQKDSDFSKNILLPIEKFSEECVALAKLKSSRGRTINLDRIEGGKYWLQELPQIPLPTNELEVSKHGYGHVPKMLSVNAKVSIATSGLSLPKIALFTLSDGCQQKMLLKYGTDDLRQDATMEQVFEKVNSILVKDRESRKRSLRIRTYKAIPLGPRAGIIEFVANSKALIEVIRPYHHKQDQMKYEKAKEAMKQCQSSTIKERVEVYENITDKVKPVFHMYFSDTFLTPDTWYSSRQHYTRGLAASSMVGHILGLGDRHCNNILLEESSGEPIHIDLGVAFDQGKRLPIPETVPFRLTRDMVDGLGITGVHGAFDKLCQHTFRVLREHRDHILAILDALRWDPLYLWSISPLRMKRLQDEGKTSVPEPVEDGSEANAAVQTVVEKFNAGGLSVEATVRQLIREATSTQNLALIYCGWCPFF